MFVPFIVIFGVLHLLEKAIMSDNAVDVGNEEVLHERFSHLIATQCTVSYTQYFIHIKLQNVYINSKLYVTRGFLFIPLFEQSN